jgi:hypothetical protein
MELLSPRHRIRNNLPATPDWCPRAALGVQTGFVVDGLTQWTCNRSTQ